ncbi:MAG: HEAT repeat domain-containing protein [Leptolyngbyaceae bacterium]|nr:HEAT repeat domain-containing protein [Leptolyngbyaceae bacterium]
MSQLDLEHISQQLESERTGDRMVALAMLKDASPQDAVPLIKKVLNDDNLQIRSMAVFALGLKATDECYPLLVDILSSDADYSIRAGAAGALGYLEDPRALEPLNRAFLEDTDWLVQFSAAVALGNLKDPRAYDVLINALDSEEVVIQQAAIAALGEIGAVDAVDRVLEFAQAEDWLLRQRLAEALGRMPTKKSLSALRYMEKDKHPTVSAAATYSIQQLAQEGIQ